MCTWKLFYEKVFNDLPEFVLCSSSFILIQSTHFLAILSHSFDLDDNVNGVFFCSEKKNINCRLQTKEHSNCFRRFYIESLIDFIFSHEDFFLVVFSYLIN